MKGKLLFAAVVVLLSIFAAVAYVRSRPPYLITKMNYERIENGMSQPEVEALLGKSTRPGKISPGPGFLLVWIGDRGDAVSVIFDPDGRASEKSYWREDTSPRWWPFREKRTGRPKFWPFYISEKG